MPIAKPRSRCARKYPSGPACVLMHGANPGLVSHLVKQALLNLAADLGLDADAARATARTGRRLAAQLEVKVIHVAERDHQTSHVRKRNDEFVNTWSSEAFCGESLQPAELGWGTHERNWPRDGREYGFGCGAAIYLDRPGVATRVRSWAPPEGPFHGWLISHGEAISIPDYLSVRENGKVVYRPTCHYAYHPATTPCCRCTNSPATAGAFRRGSACCATRSTPASTNWACC